MRYDLRFLDSMLLLMWFVITTALSLAALHSLHPALFKPFANYVSVESVAMLVFFVFFCASAWRLVVWQNRQAVPILLPCAMAAWFFVASWSQDGKRTGMVSAAALVMVMLVLGVLGFLKTKDYVMKRIGINKRKIRKPIKEKQ